MRSYWIAIAFSAPLLAQTPSPLQVTHIFSINSSTMCIDNRSPVYRQNNIHTFTASGTGTWSVQMRFSNVSCAGPWTSYGTLGFLNQASSPMLGMGFDGRATYADFVSFQLTGTPTVDYAGTKNMFFPGGGSGGSVSFPILVTQGGTGLGSGISGGILYFSSTTTMASTGLLGQHALMLGGGAGAGPSTLGSLGTSTTVLHGNVSGNPGFSQVVTGDIASGAVNLTTQVTGVLPAGNLPATLVYTGQSNVYGAFLQDYTSASLKFPNSAGASPTTSALLAYDTTANVFKGGVNGSTGVFPYFVGAAPTSGHCAQWGSGYALQDAGGPCGTSSGANAALSNLFSVSINTTLLAQTGIDLGSTSAPFRDLYIYGSGSFGTTSLRLTGTPTAARVWIVQDATDTFVGRATTDTLTGKTFDTAGAGNMFKVNGVVVTNLSGNTATITTTTGTLTPGDCPQFDASGNLKDSGSPTCGGGGGGGGLPDPGVNGFVVRTALNVTTARTFIAGSGITITNTSGTTGNPTFSYNTALIPTYDTIHANPDFCSSTNGTTAMTCSFSSTKVLTAYTSGACFDFQTDTANPVSVSIDTVGIVNFKLLDGTTSPPSGLILANTKFRACYNGTNFVVTSPASQIPAAAISSVAVNSQSFSGTPAYNLALGQVQTITLTGNVTASTFTNGVAGQSYTFIICQDGTGSRTYTWGAAWHGSMTVGSTASLCSAQSFSALNTTTLYATSPGVTNQ